MATNCAGVTATWDGVSFGEVTKIDITRGGSLPDGRDSRWTVDAGTIEIAALSTANLTAGQHGKKALLSFTGGGLTATAKAVCQTLKVVGAVNDVTRYVGTFRIVME